MTDQINKHRPSQRGPAQDILECRITHVRYVGLGVSDFDSGLGFYKDEWGLAPETVENDIAFLAAEGSADPYVLRLRAAEENRLDVVSFAVDKNEDVDWYAAKLEAAEVKLVTEPGTVQAPGGGYGFRFLDPIDGRTIEIAAEPTPRNAREIQPRESIPVGISHMVMNTPNFDQLVDFFHKHLGFYKSDFLDTTLVFMKGRTPAHHHFAVARGPHANINHVAYEMRDIDEYLRAAGAMMRRGNEIVWGPGRHGPGDNTFAYFQDPNGFVCEYTTALEPIEDVSTWEPRVWCRVPVEDDDQWGIGVPAKIEAFQGRPDNSLWSPPPV